MYVCVSKETFFVVEENVVKTPQAIMGEEKVASGKSGAVARDVHATALWMAQQLNLVHLVAVPDGLEKLQGGLLSRRHRFHCPERAPKAKHHSENKMSRKSIDFSMYVLYSNTFGVVIGPIDHNTNVVSLASIATAEATKSYDQSVHSK